MIYITHTVGVILTFLIIGLFAVCMVAIGIFVKERCENWKERKRERQVEKVYEEYIQRIHKKELRRKEKIKYPLFYLKDGIV